MSVPRGEIFGFLGPNGAGKTTAVKLLLGLATPTAGDAWLLGEPIGHAPARRRVGYLPELFRYPAWLSPVEVLRFHCRLIDIPRPRARRPRSRACWPPSGCASAPTTASAPSPRACSSASGSPSPCSAPRRSSSSTSPPPRSTRSGRHDVRDVIRSLRDKGTAVFLNSHLLSEVEQVCDRVAVVDHGRVIASGTLDELLGGGVAVRLRVTGVDGLRSVLSRWGEVTTDGEWVSVAGVDGEAIADIVAALVARGARIHAVEPQRQSLEDRFLEVLRAADDGTAA